MAVQQATGYRVKLTSTYNVAKIESWLTACDENNRTALIVVNNYSPDNVGAFVAGLQTKTSYLYCKNLEMFKLWNPNKHNGFIYTGCPTELLPEGDRAQMSGDFMMLFNLLKKDGFGRGSNIIPKDVPRILISAESYIMALFQWKNWMDKCCVEQRGTMFTEAQQTYFNAAFGQALLYVNELRVNKPITQAEEMFLDSLSEASNKFDVKAYFASKKSP